MAKAVKVVEAPQNDLGVILTAISNVTNDVGSLIKAGTNEFHNYRYAKAADLMAKLQPLMVQEGLIIIPSETSKEVMADCVLAITYEFTIGHKSGAVWPDKPRFTGMSAILSRTGAADDKAGNKTLTAAHKYFCINLFKIPTQDADDADHDGDVQRLPPKPAQVKQALKLPEPPKGEDGEPLAPSTLAMPGESNGAPSWIDWGASFIAALQTATTSQDVARWEIANSKALVEMEKAAPKAKARLMTRVVESRNRVADALIHSLEAACPQCKTAEALAQLWQANNEHLAALSKENRDRAVVVYETNLKALQQAV